MNMTNMQIIITIHKIKQYILKKHKWNTENSEQDLVVQLKYHSDVTVLVQVAVALYHTNKYLIFNGTENS